MSAMAVFISSVATIALSSVYFIEGSSFFLVVALRILIGAAHGVLFPVTYTLWAQWAVPNERGTLTSIGFCGTNLGTGKRTFVSSAMFFLLFRSAFIVLTGGLLCRYVSSGWIYIMLLSGALGFVWLPLWLWQASNTPADHPNISNEERQYIVDIIGKNAQSARRRPVSLGSLPWKEIVRSKPVIALLLTEFCNLFGLFFFLNNLGKILTEIQHIPSQYTGYILACAFLAMLFGSLFAGRRNTSRSAELFCTDFKALLLTALFVRTSSS
jgi:sugar phosphate permease